MKHALAIRNGSALPTRWTGPFKQHANARKRYPFFVGDGPREESIFHRERSRFRG